MRFSPMTSLTSATTVVLADARELFRGGLETAIRCIPTLALLGSVATPEEALALCRAESVSVLVLGELAGVKDLAGATALIADLPTETRPLLISNQANGIRELLDTGFWGCLPQTATGTEVIRAVQAVALGEFWASRRELTQLLRERLCEDVYPMPNGNHAATELTPREAEILELVARGFNNDQIAATLYIGRSTVKTHLLRSFRKLEAVDRTSAVTIALRRRLIRARID
jgi:DNA-binding NarL/FixJ family response regulator